MSSKSLDLRVQTAKQRELSLIISRMQGIEVATVTYDEIDKPGFPRRKEKSAMVAVKPQIGSELSQEQIRAIRNTVAGAYAGLDRNNVTVTDISTGRSYAGLSPDGLGSGDDHLYAEAKLRFERDWQAKIYDRLRMIPGVVVGVNVDLDPDLLHQTQSHKLDPKSVAVQTTETTENISSTMPSTAGRPGVVPNSMVNAPAQVAQERGAQSTTERSGNSQASVVGQDHITTRRAPLTPRQVQVVVDVPMSYYRKIWQERNPQVPGEAPKQMTQADLDKIEAEQKKRIEDTVVKLLPRPDTGNDPFVPVVVTSYHDLAQTPIEEPGMAEQALSWLAANWQTIGMILLGLFSLLMMRSMLQSATTPAPTPATESAAAAEANVAVANESEEDDLATVKAPRRRFNSSGPSLRDELKEMVKEDPDAAATVLRAWIGDAA
jgi:flagellar M-ring protein FliF